MNALRILLLFAAAALVPVRFILGVWAGYALWPFGFVVVMINLRLPGPP